MSNIATRNIQTPFGRLHLLAEKDDVAEAAQSVALSIVEQPKAVAKRIEMGGQGAFLKGDRLRGFSRIRHFLRRVFYRQTFPRLNEFINLNWLRENGFLAPQPLAAGTFFKWGLPHYQFLVTAEIPDARPLTDVLQESHPDRQAMIDELADTVGRLHGLGFVHRDLYLRNFLVGPAKGDHQLYLIDAWRGGPPPQYRRGIAYDLACLFVYAGGLLDQSEQRYFLERYLEVSDYSGKVQSLLKSVEKFRQELISVARRKPHRLRGLTLPSNKWELLSHPWND